MLSAEPDNVKHFVADAKAMLQTFHNLPHLNSLSLLELPVQSKIEQRERTFMLYTLMKLGPLSLKYLPTNFNERAFEKLIREYLKCDFYRHNISGLIGVGEVRGCIRELQSLTLKAADYSPELAEASSFKMNRLLWLLVFMTKRPDDYSQAVFPFATLYPLLDDILDSPIYSKLHKTRMMERIHKRLDAIFTSLPVTPPTSATIDKGESMVDECVEALVNEILKYDPLTRKDIIESLDILRYAEELDYLDERDTDAYTRCAVKGASTVKALLLISNASDNNVTNEKWKELLFVYGFILQMIDDLQDCTVDASNNICTPFSTAIRQDYNLDTDVIRLVQMVTSEYLSDLIKDSGIYGKLRLLNSLLLYIIMEAAIKHRHHLSVQLYKDLRHRLPVTKRFSKRHSVELDVFRWLRSTTKTTMLM